MRLVHRLWVVPWLALVTGCSGDGIPARNSAPASGGGTAAAAQQIVFMLSVVGDPSPPGPTSAYEVAIMNLDGSGFRQLTNDGKQKFLPHFSPDATRIVYTKFSVGGYGAPNAQADVAVLDVASSKETMMTNGGGNVQGTWSPDGRRIAYLGGTSVINGGIHVDSIWTVDADGSNWQKVAVAAGTPDDMSWGDIAWSNDDWILFTVAQTANGCFKVRTDKIRPDGNSRTKVTDGAPNCTPMGMEQSGDADPGWSPDGKTIYSSRGFPVPPTGMMAPTTERKLYAFSSDAWYPGKPESDLSLPSQPSCIEGVPKASPDGQRILLFRACFEGSRPAPPGMGIYVTDTAGSYRTFIREGFGADWNPLAR